MTFQEIVKEINNAFYRLESFMNGRVGVYQYFGFDEAFTNLFCEAKKPENFTYENCKLIGKYWELTEQIRIDYDQSNYENVDLANNEDYESKFEGFHSDSYEILCLNYERIEEFTAFQTPDEIEEFERKFSITDIIKVSTSPPQQSEKPKPTNYKADEYALAYIFDLHAEGKQVPINRIEGGFSAKQIRQDSTLFSSYDKTPDGFYRAVRKIVLEYDLNKKTDLENISMDWHNAVKGLSNNWSATKQYLIDKGLIKE